MLPHLALGPTEVRLHAVILPSLPGHQRCQPPRPAKRLCSARVASSQPETSYEDYPDQLAAGSVVQQTMGMEPFSRPTQHLSPDEVIDALYAGVHSNAQSSYMAFYSSELGGIVTDPALMVVSMDDHLVHRGHAVFDTATLTQGYLYQLDDHLDRLYRSAGKAGLTPPFAREQLRRIILDTAAASRSFHGSVRYWCGAGRGGFGISPLECLQTSFYCMVYKAPPLDPTKGWTVKTSPVPLKDPYFANLKSNNYLPNALVALDAQLEGFDQGVFVDNDGYVAEGPVMNVGIITHDGEMVLPPFEQTLAGVTLQRLMRLVKEYKPEKGRDVLGFIKNVSQRPMKLEEAKSAKEVFMVGSHTLVMPVIKWDDTEILQTKPYAEVGVMALSLRALLEEDMDPTANKGQHVEVPYGILTDQLQ